MRASRQLRIKIREERQHQEDENSTPPYGLCAYFRGKGSCSFGCWQEPACQTDMDYVGWSTPWVLGHDKRRPWRKIQQRRHQ